jgi:predicted acetyltransferase
MQITLHSVTSGQPALVQLLQFYQYDLSEIESFQVDDCGYFRHPYFEQDLDDSNDRCLLIYANACLAGFVLLDQHRYTDRISNGHTISDLFIMRRFRDCGLGRRVATTLFDRYPGKWEIITHSCNVPALGFWRSVIDRYTGGRYAESWLHRPPWHGLIHTFESNAQPANNEQNVVIMRDNAENMVH